jgi:hypothetical protein
MSLVWMPVEAGEKPLTEPTRFGTLRQILDAASLAMARVAQWLSRQADRIK